MSEPDRLHSAEYFGDSRDYWWNADFIELMARRWGLAGVRDVLDVGCGVGHWGRVLAPVLPPGTRVVGVDREPAWVAKAAEHARAAGLADRFAYRAGDAAALPFPDASFDMATCQTVLIHVADVKAVLREMLRVLRPGGLLVVAEPCNLASVMVLDSLRFDAPAGPLLDLLRFHLVCERGKQALGEGHNSIGVLVPGYFLEVGATGVDVYLSDKAGWLAPPYARPEERAIVGQEIEWAGRDFGIWDLHDTRRYFLAGGGTEDDFTTLWPAAVQERRETVRAIQAGTYHTAGGQVTYLVSGRRPR